ncbi:transcription termination factor 5, mitochondrial isoform X1 [Ischnura elegans]|uniref:transcription termination factor 5, mitochondrial isoform X1 n=1 Tax=Ischnura elegans TaxID=197161 RepID=UPI001ED887DA|nr:transcription termination factor 5, mitochondrial isoform X1 [Ischnura elegans]
MNSMRVLRFVTSYRMLCTITQPEVPKLNFRYNIRPRKKQLAIFLQDIFDCSYFQAYDAIQQHPFLQEISKKRIEDATSVLKGHYITGKDIRRCPWVLSILPVTIEHYLLILKESGFTTVSPSLLLRYQYLIRKKISLLKAHGLLPDDANVSRNVLNALKAPKKVIQRVESGIDINSDDNNILVVHYTVRKCYLEWRLDASKEEIDRMFSIYLRLRNKSVTLMRRTLAILLEELNFPKDHVMRNGFLIQAHPDEVRKIIDTVPSLGGKPIRDVLLACPTMVSATYENFIEILRALQEAGVPEEKLLHAGCLFHLTGERVKERLPNLHPMNISPEVKEFMNDEKILPVLINYENFIQRAMYLSDQHQNLSLPIIPSSNRILGSHKYFEEFVAGTSGLNIGRDLLKYLVGAFKNNSGGTLNVSIENLRPILKKNPHWRHVPIGEVKECFEMLLEKEFEPHEILSALPIVLYPSRIVEGLLKNLSVQPEILEYFQEDNFEGDDFLGDSDDEIEVGKGSIGKMKSDETRVDLVREHALQLCLYYIEKDYHFSGDGIWFRKKNVATDEL